MVRILTKNKILLRMGPGGIRISTKNNIFLPDPYLSLAPFFGILSHVLGILKICPRKALNFGKFGKTVPKMLQIKSFCQISPKKCTKFSFFHQKIPKFYYFCWCFCEILLFFPPKKSQILLSFVGPKFPQPS